MKAAIIGLGVIGKVHYDVLKRQGEDIVALCDIDAAKLNGYDNVKNISTTRRCWMKSKSTSCIFARRTICTPI